MTEPLGLVRLIARERLYRADGEIVRGTRFLATHPEAAQLVAVGLAAPDEQQRAPQSAGPWPVYQRKR